MRDEAISDGPDPRTPLVICRVSPCSFLYFGSLETNLLRSLLQSVDPRLIVIAAIGQFDEVMRPVSSHKLYPQSRPHGLVYPRTGTETFGVNGVKKLRMVRSQAQEARELIMEPKLISVTEFCVMLGIGRTKAYELFRSEVDTLPIGRRRLVMLESAERFVERQIERRTS